MLQRLSRIVALTIAAWLVCACSRPKPPTVKLERASITQVSLVGVALLLNLAVTNPNPIGFSVRSVQAKVRLGGRYDLGPVVVPRAVELPPNQPMPVDVPVQLAWTDVSSLAQLAGENRDVEYDVDGSVAVGTATVSFDIPVHWHAVLHKDDVVKATLRGLPNLIPGLPR